MSSMRVKRVAMIGALASVAGCVSQTALMTGYTPPSAAAPFQIVDERPAKERDTRFMSLLITSCDYGVRQAGDKAVVPDRISLLRDDLNAALGPRLANKKIVVSHYTIVFNNANAMRGQTYRANPGLIGAVMKPMGARCKREEMEAGWYEPDDVTTPYSPYIVEMTVSVEGKAHEIRAVYSPPAEVSPGFGEPASSEALFGAIRKATEKLIASLKVA